VKYQTTTGKLIELSSRNIGRGGEGEVLPVSGNRALVAKIFHQPTSNHRAKLEFMIANPMQPAGAHFWVTWPLDILFTKDVRPKFAGYVMPKIKNARPLFTWYNPAIRRKKCPGIDYRHLVHSGRNLAAAFNQAHSRRFIIGDPNESNVFVRNDARVILIDADSWQIASGDRIYRSMVTKLDFLAPELQNRNLKNVNRQPWHDNFALAILLFKIICEGTHPFDGVYHGGGDEPPLEARIATGAFPYRDSSGLWSPKRVALPFDSLHHRLQKLFIQAFVTGHTRPQLRPEARTWQMAFNIAERELRRCRHNQKHWFWGNQCVWCQRKALLGGIDPFPSRIPTPAKIVNIPVYSPQSSAHIYRPSSKPAPTPATWFPMFHLIGGKVRRGIENTIDSIIKIF
jgi:DNA-binding helix-hairpin-helix protein with protein kinase domain